MLRTDELEKLDIGFEEGNWFFDTIKTIFSKINKDKIVDKIEKLKKKYPVETRKQLAGRLVKNSSGWSCAAGGITSIPACFPGLGTALQIGGVGLDTVNWLRVQCVLILELAVLYGFNPSSSERILETIVILGEATGFNKYARELAAHMAARSRNKTSILTYARKLAWKMGCQFIKRNILKFIPVVGIIAGAKKNYSSTRLVGEQAITFYECKHLSGG